MSAEEALAIFLEFLKPADALRPQSRPPSHRLCACKIVAQIGRASCRGLLPPKSDLVEVRHLGAGMCKRGSYGVQREAAIVLPAAKPLLRDREQDLAVQCDRRSRIMGSVIDAECEHFLHPTLLPGFWRKDRS